MGCSTSAPAFEGSKLTPNKATDSRTERCNQSQKVRRTSSEHCSAKVPSEIAGFILDRKLGSGCYGDVYLAHRGDEKVAIKLEPASSRRHDLLHEWEFYQRLGGAPGIPTAHWYGKVGAYNALVMQLLGPSVRDVWRQHGQRFSCETVLSIAEQMIRVLQYVHSKGICHQDIKAANFCFGCDGNEDQIYLVDFGLAKEYIDSNSKLHIPFRVGQGFVGSPAFSSCNSHRGFELSRRDDMESLCYVLIQFVRGRLPWQYNIPPARVNELMGEAKLNTSLEVLCKGLPTELYEYLTIVRQLDFHEEPPYRRLLELVQKAGARKRQIENKTTGKDDGSSESTAYSSRALESFSR